jgi:molecular chaperone DnaK
MLKEAERNAEEDRKRKEFIEIKNEADSMIYSTEKNIKDCGNNLSEQDRVSVESDITKERTY